MTVFGIFFSSHLRFAFGIGINRVPFFLYFDWDFFGTQDVLMRSAPYWSIIGIGVLGILCRDVSKQLSSSNTAAVVVSTSYYCSMCGMHTCVCVVCIMLHSQEVVVESNIYIYIYIYIYI